MRRSEWIRVGAASSLACMVAFGLGTATHGHVGGVPAATASVVPTSPDGECVDALRSLVSQGVRVIGLDGEVPRACSGFDRGAVLVELSEVVSQGCGVAIRDGRYGRGGDDSCSGVSEFELTGLGRSVGRPFPAGAG